MPSYYDSTKSKPGKAALKYKEGGQVSDKELALLTDKAKKKKRRKGASLGQLSDRELALLRKDVLKPTKAKAAFKAAGGGKVKKMAGGRETAVTIARGSGAARPQKFHKNG